MLSLCKIMMWTMETGSWPQQSIYSYGSEYAIEAICSGKVRIHILQQHTAASHLWNHTVTIDLSPFEHVPFTFYSCFNHKQFANKIFHLETRPFSADKICKQDWREWADGMWASHHHLSSTTILQMTCLSHLSLKETSPTTRSDYDNLQKTGISEIAPANSRGKSLAFQPADWPFNDQTIDPNGMRALIKVCASMQADMDFSSITETRHKCFHFVTKSATESHNNVFPIF